MTAQQIIKSDFQGSVIRFNDEGWFDATAAAAKFSKSPGEWLRLPTTQEYINALDRKYGKIPYLKTKRGASGGTWLSPKLAVKFAQWLDVDFAVWCDEQIYNIIHGNIDQKKLRHEAASSFKVMSSVLQLVREEQGKVTASHHYSNEARLINWAVSGKFQSIDRNSLPAEDLSLLAKLEEKNAVLIGRGVAYDSRKSVLEQLAIDLRGDISRKQVGNHIQIEGVDK